MRLNTFMPSSLPLLHHADAAAHLGGDPTMRELIARNGDLPVLAPTPDPFGTLIRSVNGQQLSVKAAASIHARLLDRLGTLDARALLRTPGDELRAAGLSWAKVRTVKAIAEAEETGTVDFAHIATLPDEAVIAALIPLPGIGRWTAEMFLMLALARSDVFSLGDLALRQGLAQLYPTRSADAVLAGWTPYRTLAARYLWADTHRVKAGGEPVG